MKNKFKLPSKGAAQGAAGFDCDWHIHSCHSCDCRQGVHKHTMANTVEQIAASGIVDFGFTDHIHTSFNLPDLEASRQAFDALPRDPRRHFGVEASCVSAWELAEVAAGKHQNPVYGVRSGGPPDGPLGLALTAEIVERLHIEYVVGGAHWPLYVPWEREAVIRAYHRQNMFLACHPLVSVVAHPWWWMGHWRGDDGMYRAEPWLDNFDVVPRTMHDEFIAAACEHCTAVEINVNAMVLNKTYPESFRRRYCEYLAQVKEAGVVMTLGSDHHSGFNFYATSVAHDDAGTFVELARMLAPVGISALDVARLVV